MTNSQKWVAAFLVLFTLLLILGQLTKKSEKMANNAPYYSDSTDNSATEQIDAKRLMMRTGCTQCHGTDFNGTAIAPGLKKAKDHWTKDELVKYIKNPADFAADERVQIYKQNFRTVMPSYDGSLTDREISEIADFILSMEN